MEKYICNNCGTQITVESMLNPYAVKETCFICGAGSLINVTTIEKLSDGKPKSLNELSKLHKECDNLFKEAFEVKAFLNAIKKHDKENLLMGMPEIKKQSDIYLTNVEKYYNKILVKLNIFYKAVEILKNNQNGEINT